MGATRASCVQWCEKKTDGNTITFVHDGEDNFSTWREDAERASQALGGGQVPKVGGVPFLNIPRKLWEEWRDTIMAAGYTVVVVQE